ncbi:hypothetical protein H6G97_16020 [Nostoc flagelliforme FACHB-838]|uniref:Uncharacterized protein n=1 Tax=Nostoc flagelliforme FACHB-838 TaxID=2692904 RepID=A0ABR8DQ32_9NOSO|nr:hypothetical protein [Nostoc flagelliforme]MBD2531005.1 hypothetical protein [Nostoc flagelliforme FACHB-838]
MSQCGGEAAPFNRGFHATSSTEGTPVTKALAPQKEPPSMISLHETTGDFLAVATQEALPVRVNLEVSGNRFILLSNCNRTV